LIHQSAESLLHVANLVVLIVRPLPVKAEYGDAVFVLDRRIQLAIALVVRNHLAAAGEVDVRPVESAIFFLQRLSVTPAAGIALDAAHETIARRVESAANLDMVATREIELLVVNPPRHVDVVSPDAVLVVRNVIHHLRNESADVCAGGVSQVLADDAARVREPVGILWRLGVEQDARGLARACGENDDATAG